MRRFFRIWERLGLIRPKEHGKESSFWFHAASVGEVRSLKAVTGFLRVRFPNMAIVVSVMTEGGYRTALQELSPDTLFLLPIENYLCLKYLLKRLKTRLFFITDTELWPLLITIAAKRSPLILLNGRLSDKSYPRYLRFKKLFGALVSRFSLILTSNEVNAERFKSLGAKNVVISGNIKYKSAPEEYLPEPLFNGYARIAFAASTHRGEEEIFLKALPKGRFDLAVIAPRHIHRAGEALDTARRLGYNAALFTEGKMAEVVILDILGVLERVYISASKIFVGGSLVNIGGHNIFEALKYKKTVAVGPYTQNFGDITPIALKTGAAKEVSGEEELKSWLEAPDTSPNFTPFFAELKRMETDYFGILEQVVMDSLQGRQSTM